MLLPLGKVEVLASISSFATMISFMAINVALIYLRVHAPERERPFRIPLSIKKIPVIPVLGFILSLTFCLQFEGTVYSVGLLLFAVAIATGVWFSFKGSKTVPQN